MHCCFYFYIYNTTASMFHKTQVKRGRTELFKGSNTSRVTSTDRELTSTYK